MCMYLCSSGQYLFALSDDAKRPMGCQMNSNPNWVVDWPSAFPSETETPIVGAIGFDGSLLVVDSANQLWHCGLAGAWITQIAQPQGFTFASFLGAGGNCIAVLDTDGTPWVNGDPTGSGQWVKAPNLLPPA